MNSPAATTAGYLRALFILIAFILIAAAVLNAAQAADYAQRYRQQQYAMAVPPITVTAPPQQPAMPLILTPLLLPFYALELLFTPVPVAPPPYFQAYSPPPQYPQPYYQPQQSGYGWPQ